MSILIVARKSGEEWGVLQTFDESFGEDPWRLASDWRTHLPDHEVQVARAPSGEAGKSVAKCNLTNMKIITRGQPREF